MKQRPPSPTAFRVADLPQNTPTAFRLRPENTSLKEFALDLGLSTLRKLSFEGQIAAVGKADWKLSGRLGATVVQPCAVTLAPVTTRIDTVVERLYLHDFVEADAPETEMSEDDSIEPIPDWIDPAEIMQEALLLSLPLYPRAEGAELGEMVVTQPGVTPMRDEDAKPFAGLAGLRDKLSKDSSDS